MKRIALYAARFENDQQKLFPLGLGYLAAYLIQQGLATETTVRIVDSLQELDAFQPDILGVSAVSQVVFEAREFAAAAKKNHNCLTVLGGYHISLAPETLPREFDFGILGEGEVTFAELLEHCSRPTDAEQINNIDGLCFHDRTGIVLTKKRRQIQDLESLSFPLRQKRYSDESSIFTSRGCPYSCIYCAAPAFWQCKFRMRSAISVVKEIEEIIVNQQPREIAFLDDLWIADKQRFRMIVNLLEEKGITRQVTFRGFCRSNLVQEEDILLFKRMNYRVVRFGAETGSERLLKKIKGSSASITHHQRVIELCAKHKIPCSASFMFGLPGETLEDLQETAAFLNKNRGKLAIAGFYFFNPIPGTDLWKRLEESGEVGSRFPLEELQLDMTKTSFDWENIHYFNEKSIPLPVFRKFVENIREEYLHKPKVHRNNSANPSQRANAL